MPGQQVTPRTIAKLQGVGGGLHDVGYQERRHQSVETAALSTRERRTRLPVDRDPRLVAYDPCVVAGRNLIELAGLNQQLCTLAHPDRALPETQMPMWWDSHSSVRAIGLTDSLQRQPGWSASTSPTTSERGQTAAARTMIMIIC